MIITLTDSETGNLPGLGRCPGGAPNGFAMPEGCNVQAGQASRPANILASIQVGQVFKLGKYSSWASIQVGRVFNY
jgi:hypothetical protein